VRPRIGAVLVVAFGASNAAHAQTWRTIEASRQSHDTSAISAHIDYAAGRLDLKAAGSPVLYHTSVRYDADRAEPVAHFDSIGRVLSLGVHLRGTRMSNVDEKHDAGSMQAELSGRLPLDLSIELGAVEADLQLGGLRLTDLTLRGGAADITARFDQPNRENLRTMTLQVGAAHLKMLDVANSGVSRIIAEVGAGALSLDLGGTLARDVDITATLLVGGLKLNVPADAGVFVDERSIIGAFEKDGFVKRADGWYTPNYDSAARHVRVHLHAFLGGLSLSGLQK
jgi:hypothetical protein